MKIYALDTNILLLLLHRDEKVTKTRNEWLQAGNSFVIPPIADYEIQRGLFYTPSSRKEKVYFTLREHYTVGEMHPQTWVLAAKIYSDLRKKGFTIEDDDIFIAAFCLFNDYPLITRNIKHFENIAGLRCVNWVD